MLAAILAAHPHMHSVVLDLPDVITAAPAILAGHGVSDRAKRVAADFLEAVPAGGDAYLASLVLHDWPERQGPAHPGRHRHGRRQRRPAAADRVRRAARRRPARCQDLRPEHARHDGRPATHRDRMAGSSSPMPATPPSPFARPARRFRSSRQQGGNQVAESAGGVAGGVQIRLVCAGGGSIIGRKLALVGDGHAPL